MGGQVVFILEMPAEAVDVGRTKRDYRAWRRRGTYRTELARWARELRRIRRTFFIICRMPRNYERFRREELEYRDKLARYSVLGGKRPGPTRYQRLSAALNR